MVLNPAAPHVSLLTPHSSLLTAHRSPVTPHPPMYSDAINALDDQAAAKLAGQRRSLLSHFV